MREDKYDIVIVGGGLAGSTLARVLAKRGIKVLVLEREKRFKDRVRGEGLMPWGVPDARDLGVYEYLMKSCGHEVQWIFSHDDEGEVSDRRDLFTTTVHQSGFLNFYHPDMQSVLLAAAEAAGAIVRRNTRVVNVIPGDPAIVVLQRGVRIHARLVIGADGRNSNVRRWGGFEVQRDPEWLMMAGVLLERMNVTEDAVRFVSNQSIGQLVAVFPIGQQRFRCYLVYVRRDHYPTLSGPKRLPDFIDACVDTNAPSEWFSDAQAIGPLATYEGADVWVKYPYQNGVVLIGDAAATSDPTWGWGMAFTLRNVRNLRDQLLATDDWSKASHAYAREHDRIHDIMHRIEAWNAELTFTIGPEADARRTRVFQSRKAQLEPTFDIFGVGPEAPNDTITRSRFFAED